MCAPDSRPLPRRLIDLPLRIKLTFTFFVATLVSVGLLILIANRVILEQNLDDEGHDLQLIANGLALTLGELLNAQLEKLAALAADDEVRLGLQASGPDSPLNTFQPLVNELRYYQANFGMPVEFIVTDRTGRAVAATDPALPDRLIDDPTWQALLTAAQTTALIGAPHRFDIGWRFTVACPVIDTTPGAASGADTGQTLGQIVVLYELDPLTTVLLRGREESMTQAHLLLSDGQALNDTAQFAPLSLSTRSTLSVTQGLQYSRFIFQGSDQLVSQSIVNTARGPQPAIQQLGWRVILHRDYADALRVSNTATEVTDPIALLAALAAAIIAFIVATIIAAPIRQLTRVTQAAAAGDLNQRVRWLQRDELGQLADTYNAMADAIQRRERELAEERSLLAQRIADRTLELSIANDRLAIANAELARANRLKDEFLASMSHELRTPLTAILGLTEALRELDQGPLTAEQASSLRIIEDSGRHLLVLINDILDLSKIEAGKLGLQIEPVSVDAICTSSLQFIRTAAARKAITVTSETRVPHTTLNADARRLKQILVNLLSNAVKFTPAGGRVGLTVQGDPDTGQLRFTVWDTGIGIRPEDQSRLFQPFVQIDSSLARHYEGTGLGLALIARLTQLHGGTISLESTPGQGSRFTISLPWLAPSGLSPSEETNSFAAADQSEPLRAATSPIDPAASDRPLILLADDDEDSVEIFTTYLIHHGYDLVIARNGRSAIDRAMAERPAIIIMDIRMPDLDGLTAIRALRAQPDLAHVPIIALTALAMPGDRERCLAAGATAYVSKPINLRELVRIIDAHTIQS